MSEEAFQALLAEMGPPDGWFPDPVEPAPEPRPRIRRLTDDGWG